MKKALASEKYKGRTIYFTKEDHLMKGGRFRSVPTIRAFIEVNGKRKEIGQSMTKENAFAQAKGHIKRMK